MAQRKQAAAGEDKPSRRGRKKDTPATTPASKGPARRRKTKDDQSPVFYESLPASHEGAAANGDLAPAPAPPRPSSSTTPSSSAILDHDGQAAAIASVVPLGTHVAEQPRPAATNGQANGHATFKPIYSGPALKAPISFDRVVAEQLEWHWYPYLPSGQLVMLSGFPGVGKSTFLAAVAAQVSGGPMIEGKRQRGPGKVLHYATEQQAGLMTLPKLEAAGAILKNVLGGDLADDHSRRPRLAFPADLDRLEEEIRTYHAQAVIFDPITSYFGDGVRVKESQDIRQILDGLAGIAARNDCLIICTMHYRKSLEGAALQRLSGSSAFGEVAQTVIGMDKVADPDERNIISLTKHNLTAEGPSRLYNLVDHDGHAVFKIGAVTSISADDLMSAPDTPADRDALADCMRWLKSEIDEGVNATNDLRKRSEMAGHSWATVKRAKTKLGIKPGRVGNSKGAFATFVKPEKGWPE